MSDGTLYVVYSSDDNYAQHMGVSMISLFENNKDFYDIEIFVIDNNISEQNIEKLNQITNRYGRKITFIDFRNYKEKLKLNMQWNISISAYARLFLASMLSKEVEKVLYFDCDTIICSSLRSLWQTKIEGNYIAGVQDTVNVKTKVAVGMRENEKYINSGMLLINLKLWRKDALEQQFLNFINDYNGNVIHHDQGVINGVCHQKCKIVDISNNLMTIYYLMSRKSIIKYFEIKEDIYSQEEIEKAMKKPVYVHYTPSFTSRPWVKGCKHPLKGEYWKYLSISPWNEFEGEKDRDKIYIKIINWSYRNLPYEVVSFLLKGIRRRNN